MGLTRWLWKAGVDPKWFPRVAAARSAARGKEFLAGAPHYRQHSPDGAPGAGLTPEGACDAETPGTRRRPAGSPRKKIETGQAEGTPDEPANALRAVAAPKGRA
jgi:hypothetical protein